MQNPFDNDMRSSFNTYIASVKPMSITVSHEEIQDIDRMVSGQFSITVNGKRVDSRLIPMN